MADKTHLSGVCTGQKLMPGKHVLAKHLRRNTSTPLGVKHDQGRAGVLERGKEQQGPGSAIQAVG